MPVPFDAAEIIGDRQLRRGRDIGEAERRAGQPAPPIEQEIDIVEMRLGIARGVADGAGVGRLPQEQPLVHAFRKQRRRDLGIEFLVEPGAQPPRFSALLRPGAEQRGSRHRFLEIIDDGGAVGVGLLASDLGIDEAAAASAYTTLGQATGLDWAKGAAAGLEPTDPWERLLKAGLERDFEQLRLDLMRRIVAIGGDPGQAVADWLAAHGDRVARIAGPVARARSGGVVTTPMLAHLASQARVVLG